MPDQNLRFEEFFPLPREQVFAFFADPENLGRLWGGRFKRVQDSPDAAEPNGRGSVREVRAGAFKFQETIVTFRRNELIEYQVTGGGPIKNHLGRVSFSEERGGTRVEYQIAFDSRFPGTSGMFAATLRLSWTIGMPKVMKALGAA
jgi:uncharacterized protein YndB with AHSA1/START domain